MLVDAQGHIEGTVTGGCVEAELAEEAARVLTGAPAAVHTYGVSDEVAGGVGLMCGGTVRIFIGEVRPDSAAVIEAAQREISEDGPASIATLLDGPHAGGRIAVVDGERIGSFGATELLDTSVAGDAVGLLDEGLSMIRRYGADGSLLGDEIRVFMHSLATRPTMIICGAIDFSAALARLALKVGYRVTICDARDAFLMSERFGEAADVVNEWPHHYIRAQELGERDAVLVFTHDSKFDEPALMAALDSGAGYIGALGSRRTQEYRRRRLALAGVAERDLDRIVGPCGLDIGASTPMETAISILSEIIARRSGRVGTPLEHSTGSIRARSSASAATR
jgi:xanthine dehydrogenase accessory factor